MSDQWPPEQHRREHTDLGRVIWIIFDLLVKIIFRILAEIVLVIVAAFRYLGGKRRSADGSLKAARPLSPALKRIGIALVIILVVISGLYLGFAFLVMEPVSVTERDASPTTGQPVEHTTAATPAQPQAEISSVEEPQSPTGSNQAPDLPNEPAQAPVDTGLGSDTVGLLNVETFLSRWAAALTDGSEASLGEVYAPRVNYEGIKRRTLRSIADKQISVRRLMPGVRCNLEAFRMAGAAEGEVVIEADIQLVGIDPDVQRRMTRRLVLQREGDRFVIIQEDLSPQGN